MLPTFLCFCSSSSFSSSLSLDNESACSTIQRYLLTSICLYGGPLGSLPPGLTPGLNPSSWMQAGHNALWILMNGIQLKCGDIDCTSETGVQKEVASSWGGVPVVFFIRSAPSRGSQWIGCECSGMEKHGERVHTSWRLHPVALGHQQPPEKAWCRFTQLSILSLGSLYIWDNVWRWQ